MRKASLTAGTVMIAVAVTACGPTHNVSPQEKASVSALASIPGADAKTILIRAGVPLDGTPAQQAAFVRSMFRKKNRETLAKKLEIPQGKRHAFEAALLGAAEEDHMLTHPHAGLVKFLTVDLPNLLEQAL